MPHNGLENLKRDNQILVTGIILPQRQYYAFGKLTYAVVKVLKSLKRGAIQ